MSSGGAAAAADDGGGRCDCGNASACAGSSSARNIPACDGSRSDESISDGSRDMDGIAFAWFELAVGAEVDFVNSSQLRFSNCNLL